MAILTSLTVNDTGFIKLPSGTIAQRPSSPSNNMMRFNTDLGCNEIYSNGNWIDLLTGGSAVVTDGLVLHLDAGVSASYSGSGTLWKDLSGRENNATATTISTATDATAGTVLNHNSSTAITVNLSPNLNHEVWSLIFWIRSTGLTTSDYRIVLALDDTNSSHNYFYNVDTRQTINSYILGYQKDYSINSWLTYGFNNASQWDDQTWWCLGVSHNNTVFRHYVQGNFTNTQTQTRDVAGYGDINQLHINRSGSNTVYMGPVLLYDRILTDDEFNQNYNALKGRFGL